MSEEYKVKLEVFEGPLDLLLYLIRKSEVDIYDIPIERITKQYVEYLNLMRMLDLDIAGEFLVMAATLMMIKSRTLLPVEDRPMMEDEVEEDPRWELIRSLVEYKKFKDVAIHLQKREIQQENMFARRPVVEMDAIDDSLDLGELSIFDLINAFNETLKRAAAREDLREIFEDKFTVADKIQWILGLMQEKATVLFSLLFEHAVTRTEIVVTFLALLELIKMRQLRVRQGEHFGEIEIIKAVT
ncbi:MAG: chromosome segregation protein ScpA [Verrucomicrobiae bacterium]|nr:chromosome segregation protein ScpA [Verrucomicrobiae bacterium]